MHWSSSKSSIRFEVLAVIAPERQDSFVDRAVGANGRLADDTAKINEAKCVGLKLL